MPFRVPSFSTAKSTIASTADAFETSTLNGKALTSLRVSSSATFIAPSRLKSATITLAPSMASARAAWWPMPLAPPVTMIDWFSSFMVPPRGRSRTGASRSQSDLLHEGLVVPEQDFLVELVAIPMGKRAHLDLKLLPRGLNRLAVGGDHWLCERPGHFSYHSGPVPGGDPDCMGGNFCVWGVAEHVFHVLDVFVEPLRLVTVGPDYDDVVGMGLVKQFPVLF